MKVLLVNPTFHPVPGSAESSMKFHAESLAAEGHEVTVLAGRGSASSETYAFKQIDELDPGFPLNQQVKKAVDHGQTDHHLQQYTATLQSLLKAEAEEHDLVMSYGPLTTHFNLALTQALLNLSRQMPVAEWAIDLTAANDDYSLPFKDRMPWALMHQPHDSIHYIAPTEFRKNELLQHLSVPGENISLIPLPCAPSDVLGLSPDLSEWLASHEILQRDIVLYTPSRLIQRKALDQALQMIHSLKEGGYSVAWLASAAPNPHAGSFNPAEGFVMATISQLGLQNEAFLMRQQLAWEESMWSELFRVSDVLLLPSRYECTGQVLVEAAMCRLPVWRTELESLSETDDSIATPVNTPEEAPLAAEALMEHPYHLLRKKAYRNRSPRDLCREKLLPLLKRLTS